MADRIVAVIVRACLTAVLLCGASPLWAASPLEKSPVLPHHPRLGFRPEGTVGARTFSQVRGLYEHDEVFRGYFLPTLAIAERALQEHPNGPDDPLLFASCWVATGEERFARAALTALERTALKPTAQSDYYCPVWEFALAYDWLFTHPAMTDARRRALEKKIADVLASELHDCDGGYSVVWHGRTQLANNALVAALALSLDSRAASFQQRALTHYADAVKALEVAEGWPEGTGYWIHNRAFPFALAADCYRTATGRTRIGDTDIREGLRKADLWQLYSLQPDGRFVRYGDCWEDGIAVGPGLWQPVVDYYARLTADPDMVAIADYFRKHSRRHYHAGRHGWSAVLAYDPALPMPEGYDRANPEAYLNAHLPHSYVCGRRTLGEAFLTSGWGDPNAPWISVKAGQLMAHHGHYDQGSFTIFLGSPLAVHSGTYTDYFSPYRLGYFVQTVSKNSLLIHAPGEFSTFSRDAGNFDTVTGGQRVLMPTGSGIMHVQEWFNHLYAGRHYAASEFTAFDSVPGVFDYLCADITRAYNSTLYAEPGDPAKVSSVVRRFLYLREPQAVLILDRITTTDPSYRVEWLLHTPTKPQSDAEKLLEGAADNGILSTPDHWLNMTFGTGRLSCQVLLPEQTDVLKIGGPNYDHYVSLPEGGRNLEPSGDRQEREAYGRWRLQLASPASGTEHLFLTALFPRLAEAPVPTPARLVSNDDRGLVLAVGSTVAVFAGKGRPLTYTAPAGTTHHVLVDLPTREWFEVVTEGGTSEQVSSADGSIHFAAGAGQVALTPARDTGDKGGYQ